MLVVVGIIDSNDHGPRFSMSQYNTSVAEDATTGTNVLAIQAVDLDAVSFVLEYEFIYLKQLHGYYCRHVTLDFSIIISNNFTIILHVNFVNEMYF